MLSISLFQNSVHVLILRFLRLGSYLGEHLKCLSDADYFVYSSGTHFWVITLRSQQGPVRAEVTGPRCKAATVVSNDPLAGAKPQ